MNMFTTRKMADIETLLPGFKKAWDAIKKETGTKQRCPKTITFASDAMPMFLHDGFLGRRFTLNLETMEVGGGVRVSSGEWAVHGGSNNDQALTDIPMNMALLDCSWNDYYRDFSIRVQVNPANMPKALPGG